ncbi:3-Deoxy-D-manno-octulosonate 8-phosphate phosphatase, YrbI family [Elusimicrobium minutum Pei191]|uniref:3-Deoxy-D-manno-octulosonate 8-phosphate phosphatase, YrbI family n=1 Tax=Elusimicrobium minutum (strain Pei191) TaxID=445932 RepID=B2KEV2_ELUMP|nr:HAD hydrolase family protein [Elusimicrobium minutum]ACC99048.1 3-Deoxy-D-manno-octulosonate 8-phosphate phosphatase, YrbI family [Elusimicrobium minutum Pei191]
MRKSDITKRAEKVKMLVTDVDGVLTDGSLQFFNWEGDKKNPLEIKKFYSLDGVGLLALKGCGIQTAIITGGVIDASLNFVRNTGFNYIYHSTFAKRAPLEHLQKLSGISYEEMAFVGDDVIDLPVLKRVGLSCVVPNSAEDVFSIAHYHTKNYGGRGAIREVCELILRAQGKWDLFLENLENGIFMPSKFNEQHIFSREDLEKLKN